MSAPLRRLLWANVPFPQHASLWKCCVKTTSLPRIWHSGWPREEVILDLRKTLEFEMLSRWHISTEFAMNSAGLLTSGELARTLVTLGVPQSQPRRSV